MKDKRGFTLIELLAVLTIMGVLLLVAIPVINKLVVNSRKNSFAITSNEYMESVKKLWESDIIKCGGTGDKPSFMKEGNYYIVIDTKNKVNEELIEQGGKSSWGNKDVKGYVRVQVTKNAFGVRETKYYVALTDGEHGIKEGTESLQKLDKNDVLLDVSKDKTYFEKTGTTCVTKGVGTTSKDLPGQILERLGIKEQDIHEKPQSSFQYGSSGYEGIFKMKDYDGDSYYFRGDANNNYVKLGDDYYRIIRMNGNRNIRLIYDGKTTVHDDNDNFIAFSKYKPNRGAHTLVSYHDSLLVPILNEWYDKLNYKHIITNDVYCAEMNYTTDGVTVKYPAYNRITLNNNPSLQCAYESRLNLNVGLVNADELMLGGLKQFEGQKTYLTEANSYWTITPSDHYGVDAARVFTYEKVTGVFQYPVDNTAGVRPVINIKSTLNLKNDGGNGTAAHPFTIEFTPQEPETETPFPTPTPTPNPNPTPTPTEKHVEMVSGTLSAPKVGDTFKIQDEKFYILSWTATDITAIAEFNLNFGGEFIKSTNTWKAYDGHETGRQHFSMKGFSSGQEVYRGTTAFSETSNEFRGSIIERYINHYDYYLKQCGVNVKETRLLKKEEFEKFPGWEKPYWLYGLSYWTQTKNGSNALWTVQSETINLKSHPYNYKTGAGVRPVVTIPKTEFK